MSDGGEQSRGAGGDRGGPCGPALRVLMLRYLPPLFRDCSVTRTGRRTSTDFPDTP
jgi:hypothetical protein